MKTANLLFLTIGWAALAHGTGYAIPPGPASQPTSPGSPAITASSHPRDARHAAPPRDAREQTDRTASDEQRNHGRGSDTNHLRRRASLTAPNRPKQSSDSRKGSLSANAVNLRQPDSDQSGRSARSRLIQNETVHPALPVRTSSVFRPTGPLNNVRHRGPNAAVVGGSTISEGRRTGEINGTRMIRRP